MTQSPASRHTRQSAGASAPEQPVQNGFRLVIPMVSQHQQLAGSQDLPEYRVSGCAGRGLQTLAGIPGHRDAVDLQVNIESVTDLLAQCCPVVGTVLKTVVYVNGGQRRAALPSPQTGEVQQHHAVTATAEPQPPARRAGVPLEFGDDLLWKCRRGQGQLP